MTRGACVLPGCGREGRARCSVCRVWYCSADCQALHWPHHLQDCLPLPPLEWPGASKTQEVIIDIEDGSTDTSITITDAVKDSTHDVSIITIKDSPSDVSIEFKEFHLPSPEEFSPSPAVVQKEITDAQNTVKEKPYEVEGVPLPLESVKHVFYQEAHSSSEIKSQLIEHMQTEVLSFKSIKSPAAFCLNLAEKESFLLGISSFYFFFLLGEGLHDTGFQNE